LAFTKFLVRSMASRPHRKSGGLYAATDWKVAQRGAGGHG